MGDIKTTPFSIIYDSKKNFVIYLHYCLVTNKIYIGQTCQKPEYRWNHGKGYIKNECFYNDIQKYGWDEGFKHLILETNLNAQEANEREKFWIEYYNSYSNGYNKTSGGSSPKDFSDETIKKIKNARKKYWESEEGLKRREEMSSNMKNFWNSFEGSQRKKEYSNIFLGSNNPMYGKKHSDITKQKQSESKKGINNCNYGKTGIKNHLSIPIVLIEKNRFFGSGRQASIITGIDASSIAKCCKGKQNTAGGYHWRYANQNEIEQQLLKEEKENG